MRRVKLSVLLVFLLAAVCLFGQSLSSVNGVVTDPSGAVVPGAQIVLENVDTRVSRDTVSDAAGRYVIPQVQPGRYKIVAKAAGFNDVIIPDVRLLVNSPATVNIAFSKLGAVTQSVEVTVEAAQLNSVDASLGNAFSSRPILQLPLEARNVVGLLALQPGVVFTGEDSSSRNGAVNGGKSDQANVNMDGVDVNDQQNRSAFTSVLRATLDSVQEFRVTTTNANANSGRSSGAQIALITKSGSNELHGSLYEFHRNTVTTANSFFNNLAGVQKPKLIRNTFGASAGGPLKKNRLFYFFNYEGRRDAKEGSASRVISNADYRQGIVKYLRNDGSVGTLLPADLKRIDPLGIGANPGVLKVFQSYPAPNDITVGNALNTAGFRFIAPLPLRWNTYVTRWDYSPTDSGKHQFFLRANLQNDHSISMPQFPGDPPNGVNLNNSKGMAAGYNLVIKPNLIGTLRYGYTRQGVESTGIQSASYVGFLNMDDRYGPTAGAARLLPVHTETADFTWIKGAHSAQFGNSIAVVTNSRRSFANSFNYAQVRSTRLKDSGSGLDAAVPDVGRSGSANYRQDVINVLGVISTGTANYNYDLAGNVAPVGAPVVRNFRMAAYGMYAQDTWKISRALTMTAGLRWELNPPIRERDGLQISLSPSLGAWFDERGALARAGKSSSTVTPIKYIPVNSPGGTPLYALHKKNFAPRLALAYSPQVNSGILRTIFGGPGQTSIRAGWGMYYDAFGNSLILRADSGGLGLSSSTQIGSVYDAATGPRFTGLFEIPAALVGAPTKYTFPITAPNLFAYGGNTSNIDSQIRPPYTMNMNFSIGREFKNGLFIQGSYVGRLSRRSLVQTDPATPLNLVEPASGMTYYQAATQLALLLKAGTPVASVPRIPYWENLWNGSGSLSATQYVYQQFSRNAPDYSTALENIDRICNPCLGKLGSYAFFDKQFASITAWRSIAGGAYHAMQWTIRQRMAQGVEGAFNYTWSKSIDLSSRAEGDSTGSNFGFITNPWMPWIHKAVSDYDMTHQWNASLVAELPFGKGRKLLDMGGLVNAILGGWQISGLYRQTTGLPISVRNGSNWPTNYQWQGWATMMAPIPGMDVTKNAPAITGKGGPNIFRDPKAAFASFDFTLPGGFGNRNVVRGDGYFTIDTGLSKRFVMPFNEKHSLQFRWETFNLTNSAQFDIGAISINIGSPGTFGKFSDTLTQPRVMQFGLRYEF